MKNFINKIKKDKNKFNCINIFDFYKIEEFIKIKDKL